MVCSAALSQKRFNKCSTGLNGGCSDSEIKLHSYVLNLHLKTEKTKKSNQFENSPLSQTLQVSEFIGADSLPVLSSVGPQAAHRVCSRWDLLHHSAKWKKEKRNEKAG